jgi:hypothetical protein
VRRLLPLLILVPALACLPDDPIGPPVPTTELSIELGDSSPHYIDLIAGEEVAEGDGWDLRIEGWQLFLNGGESGEGKAGGIDMQLLDLTMEFDELLRKNQLLYFFFYDSYACALSDWWWYALDGTHTLFSSYHTYIVRRGERDFAFQWLDYYQVLDGAAAAGYPQFRWAEVPTDGSEAEVWGEELDATAGGLGAAFDDPTNKWTYFSFDDGVVDLTDNAALADESWDLGFKRFYIKSNSGPSGPAGVVTTDFDADRGETAEDVLDFTPGGELARFEDRIALWDPASPTPFEVDAIKPVVDRWHSGQPGSAENPPLLDNRRWFLLSDRSGTELAKFRVLSLEGSASEAPDRIRLEWAVLE